MSAITTKDGTSICFKAGGPKSGQTIRFQQGGPPYASDRRTQMPFLPQQGFCIGPKAGATSSDRAGADIRQRHVDNCTAACNAGVAVPLRMG